MAHAIAGVFLTERQANNAERAHNEVLNISIRMKEEGQNNNNLIIVNPIEIEWPK